jgi:hypothetical protein
MEGGSSAFDAHKERKMRKIFIALAMASGVGLLTSSPTLAAPVHGMAIDHAARFGVATEQVHWRWWRHHRHHHHHHYYYRRWW